MLVIEVQKKSGVDDIKGEGLKGYITKNLNIPVYSVTTTDVYAIDGELTVVDASRIGEELLADRIVEEHTVLEQDVYSQPEVKPGSVGSWKLFVGHKRKPLVLDPWGDTTKNAISDMGIPVESVRHLKGYLLEGELTEEQILEICAAKLADNKVEDFVYFPVKGGMDATG